MSEEEHEHEHVHPLAFLLGRTAEQVERERMVTESNSHEMRSFFYSLSEEQLVVLLNVISNIIHSEGAAGSYYQGLIAVIIETKYHKCLACGKDHDAELTKLAAPNEEAIVTEAVEQAQPPAFPAKGTEPYDQLMVLYGMEQDDEGTDNVMCKNCGKWYPNLQDRTLRASDKSGCPGCVHKEKFG